MSNTKNSFSSLIAQFLRLQKNSLEIINKFNEVATSPKDSVEIEVINDDGTSNKIQIPSFGYLKGEIQRLDQNVLSLSGLEDSTSNIRKSDGTVSKIFQASILKDPSSPTSLQVPSTFNARNNWFFESFLNPLLYISINVDNQIPVNSNKVLTKRIIANTQTDTQKSYFDTNLKGKNNLTDSEYISALKGQGIPYFVDEQIVDLELRTVRYKGGFSVLKIYDEETEVTQNGVTTKVTTRKYKLSSLKYTDTLESSENTRTLSKGDKLITKGGTKYEITSIDTSSQTIVLKRLFGFEAVQIGADTLSIYSTTLSPRIVEVNVGFDERQAVFIKSIDEDFNVASSTFSPGVIFWSNELQINTSEGVKTLEYFYNAEVADFGKTFISAAKENSIPAVYGKVPSSPVLSPENFKVLQINGQITDSTKGKEFKAKLQEKTSLQNEIKSIDQAINQERSTLANITTTSAGQSQINKFKQITEKIAQYTKNKATKTSALSSTIAQLNNLVDANPELTEDPKYRVRGFWAIPSPVQDPKTGDQNVVQFNVRYRYLSNAGSPNGTQSTEYTDNDGTKKSAQFSEWNLFKGEVRKKEYNQSRGVYTWVKENPNDPSAVNINQLDVPITKGEKVEIQVQAISEAGFPTNPLLSPWSESVVIDFPAELSTQTGNKSYIAQNNVDQTVVTIENNLQAKGLDQHLNTSFSSGDKYFAHTSDVISSGFFDGSGKSLDLFQKLTQIDNELQSLRALIAKAKGTLAVYIKSDKDSPKKITNGSTVNLFAGYYTELQNLSNPNNYGKISSVKYTLELRNEAATPLELSSIIAGGLSVKAPDFSTTSVLDYDKNRKYGNVPIQVTSTTNSDILNLPNSGSFKQLSGYQSCNSYSQFIYNRYKSVGLDSDLYFSPPIVTPTLEAGVTSSGKNYPIHANGNLIPFKPDDGNCPVGDGPKPLIWKGTYSGTSPEGGGSLNEFCVHISHPDLNGTSFIDLIRPAVTSTMRYPSFRHALGFETDTNTNASFPGATYQTSFNQQLSYSTPSGNFGSGGVDSAYPSKLGFVAKDEWLCGKYSCGAYLYLAPASYSSVQVEGSTELAVKKLEFGENNSITIPVIFEFRTTDKLKYVGGWRSSGALANITYTKKLGIDIKVKSEDLFSFDLVVTGTHTKDSLVAPSYAKGLNLERIY